MADHVIYIDPLDPFSVVQGSIQYRRIMRHYEELVDLFLQRLAECGRDVCESLGYTLDSGEITVTVDQIDNGYQLNANGKGVVFLEFGAGDTVDSGNIFAEQMPFDVASGSYSDINSQQYSISGRWIFGGVIYTEVVPRGGMQKAWETILQEWRTIAEEVFA